MFIFSAPFYALTNIDFYKWAAKIRLWKALQYLLFLSLTTSAVGVFAFATRAFPVMDRFVDWIKVDMPYLTLTQDSLVMNVNSPYTMIHPNFGPLIRFDLTVQDASPDDLADVLVFVTARRLYIRQRQGALRVYDIFDPSRTLPLDVALITPDTVDRFYRGLKPWLLGLVGLLSFIFFFLWKMVAALFYSWIGLLINMTRRGERLTIGSIYNISIFAMTAAIVFQWIRTFLPILNVGVLTILINLILTTVYLYLGIKKTEEKEPVS